jgi:hypothetical protein
MSLRITMHGAMMGASIDRSDSAACDIEEDQPRIPSGHVYIRVPIPEHINGGGMVRLCIHCAIGRGYAQQEGQYGHHG